MSVSIFQSGNNPIVINMRQDLSAKPCVEFSLYRDKTELKHWTYRPGGKNADILLSGNYVQLSYSQDESRYFSEGPCYLSAKYLDIDGFTRRYKIKPVTVDYWFDRTIMEGV